MSQLAPGLPIFRGTFHAQMAVLMPTIWAVLAIVRPDHLREISVIFIIFWLQLIASARLHLLHHFLSPRNLRWTQRFDHCMVALSIALIGWTFGAPMKATVLWCLFHFMVKIRGDHRFTTTNGLTLAGGFIIMAAQTMRVLRSREQRLRFAICAANVVASKLAFVFGWPCRDHPVLDYHDLAHVATVSVMGVLFWEALS